MEHVVFFTGRSGAPEFRRVDGLDEAVRLVESLRNEQGVVDVTLHALTPVPVSFRTYYRVEVGAPTGQSPTVREAEEPAAEPAREPAREPMWEPLEARLADRSEHRVPAVEPLPRLEPVLDSVPELEPEPEPKLEPVLEPVPMLLDDREEYGLLRPEEPFELPAVGLEVVPDVEEEPVAATPLALLPPPLESEPVHDLDEPVEGHDGLAASVDSAASAEPASPESDAEFRPDVEPLVPQVRPDAESERSLGYFAN